MNRRNNYYKISKKDDFVAKSQETNSSYRFGKESIKDLKQRGKALIAKELNELFAIYIETHEDLLEVMRSVYEYQYFNNTLLLKKENHAIIIKPNSYSDNFGLRGISTGEIKHQSIFGKNVNIREEFDDLGENVICNVDGVDYFIKDIRIFNYPQVKIIKLGRVEHIPGNNGCFKVITDEGEYIHEGDFSEDESPILYNSVERFNDEDYPEIFPKETSYGYWSKDSTGIVKMTIYTNNQSSLIYKLHLDKPAKSINFIRRIEFSKDFHLDVWKVVYADSNEEKYLLKCKEELAIIEPTEFIM